MLIICYTLGQSLWTLNQTKAKVDFKLQQREYILKEPEKRPINDIDKEKKYIATDSFLTWSNIIGEIM